ncbi:MAG: hypothetical protein HZC38_18155 [Chloroflexi bacterium]|nr:hypothetical protein [Chloroflexota bacterium]
MNSKNLLVSRKGAWLVVSSLTVLTLLSMSQTSITRNVLAAFTLYALRMDRANIPCPFLSPRPQPDEIQISQMYEVAQDSRADYLIGLYDFARGKLSTAEIHISRSANSSSDALPIYSLWAGCLKEALGDEVGAADEWRAARARDYFMRKGDSFFSRGDYAESLREYTIVVRIEPTFADGWLGVAASQQNLATVNRAQWSDMLISAQTALALAPQDPQAHYLVGYGLWLSGGDVRQAESHLRWALNKRAYWGDVYTLGRMLLDQGVAGEPTALMQKALSLKTDNDEIRAQLVRAYLAEGQCVAAQQEARRALALNPSQRERLQQICDAYNACGCVFDH